MDRLEVNNVHSFGGCVVLEDTAHRHGLAELLAPLSPRSASLVQAMIFGGLLFPPSLAPFSLESRSVRLAAFCGLDAEREAFDLADLAGALRELDARWTKVCVALMRPPHAAVRAVTLFHASGPDAPVEMGAVGLDAEGIPVPLNPAETRGGLAGFLQEVGRQSNSGTPLLALDEETAVRMNLDHVERQPYLIEMEPESVNALIRQLNHGQLMEAMRGGGPVEVKHHGERYVLAQSEETQVTVGSLGELNPSSARRRVHGCVHTNVPAEVLPAAAVLEWAARARMTRLAFSPVQILLGWPASGGSALAWRNHPNLQFLTHRLRCHLRAEWRAHGETRPVEKKVLRDLQELHRATLTVGDFVVRRLASHPSKAAAALLTKLDLWRLFDSSGE